MTPPTPHPFFHQTRSLLIAALLLTPLLSSLASDYTTLLPSLQNLIEEEMREWNIGGVAIALVDDQSVVHAQGFGQASRESVFRAGSVSKLFNAIAVMQQVETGKLNLDDPLPSTLLPINPFPTQPDVTLRQLLCHRSGLQREAPVGGYLDSSHPGLNKTVASLSGCVLVTPPGSVTRYSNIGASLAGFLVQRAAESPFETYQQEHLLNPLNMSHSAWTLKQLGSAKTIPSYMRLTDGKGGWSRKPAPLFDLGTIPAGNLFTTVDDLALFASALMRPSNGLLKPESLAEMWRPQLTDQDTGFGLGFFIGKFRNHRSVGHNGAVYGHSTSFAVLPDAKLAVIVCGNEDIANGRIRRISDAALSLMLQVKLNEQPPAIESFQPQNLNRFTGLYESQSYWADLRVQDNQLTGDLSGQPTRFTPVAELQFHADSRINHQTSTEFQQDDQGAITGFTIGSQIYVRVPDLTIPLPQEWRRCLGTYGPDFIPLVVSERHGHLYVMTENMVDYRMTPINRNSCSLPPGMYVSEQAVFLTDPDGQVHGIDFANMVFKKTK